MRIYVSARYSRREEMVGVHRRLRELGHWPTSRWVEEGEEEKSDEAQLRAALMDVEDVCRSDAILFVGDPPGAYTGGGRWFELGMAWVLRSMSEPRMRLIVVLDQGHRTVFTRLPEMELCESLDSALALLARHDR